MFALHRMPPAAAPAYVKTAASSGPGAAQATPSVARARKKAAAAGKREAPKAATSNKIDLGSQLFDALAQEKERVVRRLLASGGVDPNLRNADGETLLMRACAVRDPGARGGILGCLLEHGADVDARDGAGRTALARAALLDRPDAVAALLGAGCSLEAEDCDGNNALSHAATRGGTETVRQLAAGFRRRGLDVDKCNMRGLTPLLAACQRGHLESARILVEVGGASPSIRDLDNFMTAADWMRLSGRCSSPEMAFLSTSSRRKRRHHHGHSRTSCLPSAAGSGSSSSSIPLNKSGSFPLGRARRAARERADDWQMFPQIDAVSPPSLRTDATPTSADLSAVLSPSSFVCRPRPKETTAAGAGQPSSMFALPSLSKTYPQIKTHSTLDPAPMAPSLEGVPFTKSFKSDLYNSAYLARRKGYVHGVRNHRSKFYSEGALAPLSGNSLDEAKSSEQGVESSTSANATLSRHSKLPPLKSRHSNTK